MMLKCNRKKILLIVSLLFIILSVAVFLPIIHKLSEKLSKTTKVDANILLIEGWLPHTALEMAFNEYNENEYDFIVTTGLQYTNDYLILAENGYLIFYLSDKLHSQRKTDSNLIEIDASSQLGGVNAAHFNLWINDSLVADFFAEKMKKKYSINWAGSLSDIDSVMVQFTNDGVGNYGDRNLYVKDLVINRDIVIPFQHNSVYDIDKLDGKRRIVNNINSNAERAAKELISFGIDSNHIVAIPGKRVRINRTLNSALAFRDWLEKSNLKVEGINIVSSGAHSMRTWMTFNKVLHKSYKIGIISLPDYRVSHSKKYKILKTLREAIGIAYYWIILIPY